MDRYTIRGVSDSHGAYHLRREGDVLHLRHVGDASLPDAMWLNARILNHAEQAGPLYLLIDQSQAGSTSVEGRKWLSQNAPTSATRAIALFGGSTLNQSLARLALRAIMLVRNTAIPIGFFPDVTAARAWLAAQRGNAGPAGDADSDGEPDPPAGPFEAS
jgi:hypothetical protein